MKFILFSILLVSCAAPQVISTKNVDSDASGQVGVTNGDFIKQKPIPYAPQQDHYPISAQGSAHALEAETGQNVQHLSVKKIQNSGELAVMISSCYSGKFKEGLAIADKIYATHQELPSYWNQIATCFLLQGSERKALLFYNKALEVTPQYVPALNNIGVLYQKNDQSQKALIALKRAHKQGRLAKTPRYNLANLYLSFGLAAEALPLFRGLTEETPGDFEMRVGLSNCYVHLGQWPEAWQEFNKFPENIRRRSDVGISMALTAYRLGKKVEASKIMASTEVVKHDERYALDVRRLLGE